MNEPHKTMPSISSSCNFILPWLQNLTSSFVYSWEIIPPVANFLLCAFCHLENSCDSIAPLDWLILLVTRSGEGRKSREQADLHILVLASQNVLFGDMCWRVSKLSEATNQICHIIMTLSWSSFLVFSMGSEQCVWSLTQTKKLETSQTNVN